MRFRISLTISLGTLALLLCCAGCAEQLSLRNAPLVEGGSASATHITLPHGDVLDIAPAMREPALAENIWPLGCGEGAAEASKARFVLPASPQPPIYVLAIDAAAPAPPTGEDAEDLVAETSTTEPGRGVVEVVLDLPQPAVVWLVSATETQWKLVLRPGSVLPAFEVLSPSVHTEARLVRYAASDHASEVDIPGPADATDPTANLDTPPAHEPVVGEASPEQELLPSNLRYHLWHRFAEGYPFVITPFGQWRGDAELCTHATFFERFDVLPTAFTAGARRLADLRAARTENERAASIIDRCGLAGLRALIEAYHSAPISALDTCQSPRHATLSP